MKGLNICFMVLLLPQCILGAGTSIRRCRRETGDSRKSDCENGEICALAEDFDNSNGCNYTQFENICFTCGCATTGKCAIILRKPRIKGAKLIPKYACQCDDGYMGTNCDLSQGLAGRSFITGFMENEDKPNTVSLYIAIASAQPVNVNVSAPYANYSKQFSIDAEKTIQLDPVLLMTGASTKSSKGVLITSDADITVFAINVLPYTLGGNLVFPEHSLSRDYVVAGHTSVIPRWLSEFLIVGTENNTVVTLQFPNGSLTTINLDRLGTFQYQSFDDVSGTFISASSNVVVLSGHVAGHVVSNYADHLVEQMPPLDSLQTAFVVSYMKPRPHFFLRIIAAHNDTSVNISTMAPFVLNKGEVYTNSFTNYQTLSLTSTKGILVVQYGQGLSTDSISHGDASMVVIPGIGNFANNYQFIVPDGFDSSTVMLYFPASGSLSRLRHNAQIIDTSDSISVNIAGHGDYIVIHIPVPVGRNTITNIDGTSFGGIMYGGRDGAEYAWSIGMDFK